jgi:type 1 fimbria pilin
MSTTGKIYRGLLMTLFVISASVQAVDNQGTKVNITAEIVAPPPCTINDDNRINVDFGERVGISKVDGVNYRQPLNYQITCESAENNNSALILSLNGTAAGFDVQALQSNKGDMGIRIYQNDVPFTPNSALAIDLSNPPKLEAVPVKRAGSVLAEGTFDSWATLRVDYQ